jgi:hypothetical protein
MPCKTEVLEYFSGRNYPVTNSIIDYLIVKAEIEMQHLNLTNSTIGQYRHSWTEIRRYFIKHKTSDYDEHIIRKYLREIDSLRKGGLIKEWKWKITVRQRLF